MANDPFKNFKPLNSRSSPRTPTKSTRSNNFVESVRDMGSSVVDSLKNDVVKGTAQSIFDQLLGSAKFQIYNLQIPQFTRIGPRVGKKKRQTKLEEKSVPFTSTNNKSPKFSSLLPMKKSAKKLMEYVKSSLC